MKVVAFFLSLCVLSVFGAQTNDFSHIWTLVDGALKQGAPAKAIEMLAAIEKQATERELWGDAVKAVVLRADLDAKLRGDKSEEILPALQDAAGHVPGPMRPFMELLTAHHYWRYFLRNRDRFSARKRLDSEADLADIGTWNLSRIFAEIEDCFRRALVYERLLKQIPIDAFGDLLEKGTVPDAYRPTLYDFIVYELIDFYALGEWAGVSEDDHLELAADGPALEDVPGFCFIIPDEAAHRSHVLRAMRLFQKLLAFHEKDEDPSAYADADLNRLRFCYNQMSGPNRAERYAVALDRFARKWKAHEVSARAYALRARLALAQDAPGMARMFAQNGAALYPKSRGASQCRNLVAEIEMPSVSFASERVWCEPWPALEITYRNLSEVQFRAVPVSFEEMFAKMPLKEARRQEIAASLIRRKPDKVWRVVLPPVADFKEKTYRVSVPKDLRPGLYAVFASTDGAFVKEGQPVSWGLFRVSKLALVVDQSRDHVQGFVLTAREGVPVAGARVMVWRGDGNQTCKRVQTILTGEDGAFSVLGEQVGELLICAEKGGEAAQTWRPVWKGNEHVRDQTPAAHVAFFTDRALYRLGQTVQYKGIYFVTDKQNGLYHAMDGKPLTVRFSDGSGNVIAEQTVTSNDYGSFSGSFAVPQDGGTGTMILSVEGKGLTRVAVEEYARPTFEVMLAPPADSARLGSVVSLEGHAVSCAGSPLGGAKVLWRVLRSVRVPDGESEYGAPDEVARGRALCDGDGDFSIAFFAKPDRERSEKDEAVFTFHVTAEVTDVTGETHTGEKRVILGVASWRADVVCDAWQTAEKPVSLSLSLKTHDGTGVSATGEIKVFSVKQPDQVRRPPCSFSPTFGSFLGDKTDDCANVEKWPDDKELTSEEVQTGTNGLATGQVPLKEGLYRIRFETRDPSGKAVTACRLVHVIDPDAKKMRVKVPAYFEAASWRVEPGETFKAVWGSGYDTVYALVIVEQNGRELMRVHTGRGETQRKIEMPVTDAMCGGVLIRMLFVRENRLYDWRRMIDVPWSGKRLSLKWSRFTSKLEPGKKETWQAIVSDTRGVPAMTEVVATLYDRSLDVFADRAWPTFDGFFNRCEREGSSLSGNERASLAALFGDWRRVSEPDTWRYRSWTASIGAKAVESRPKIACDEAPERAVKVLDAQIGAVAGGRSPVASRKEGVSRVCLPRRTSQETAFFLPHLTSDENGMVNMAFTVPETVTGWRLMAFAHDRELRGGTLSAEAVTTKDLRVEPDPPRFVREGDEVLFAVKVSNRSDKPLKGRARLGLSDAVTRQSVDAALGNGQPERDLELGAGESLVLAWRLRIPDGQGFLTYKATAATDTFADGEEGWLPVLSRRLAVQDSMTLPIRGKKTKVFDFAPLLASKGGQKITPQMLTVQIVSHPAWCAVLALPYLMTCPYAGSEQTFNRYYANALARHIVGSDQKIRQVVDQWRKAGTLEGPLAENAEMKSLMRAELPWFCGAESENASSCAIGRLFETRRLEKEERTALNGLSDMRIEDGTWPWFPGGCRNDFMTFTIVSGFGRLRQLGVAPKMELALAALPSLDAWVTERYKTVLRGGRQGENQLTPMVALALYARSFFLNDCAIGSADRDAFAFFTGQAKRYGLKMERPQQAHLALALKRWGDAAAAASLLKAVRDTAVTDEEKGMYWRDERPSASGAHAPVETRALMLEALSEIAGDADAAEACKVWLLRQKQLQGWESPLATASAVYALLLGDRKLTDSDVQADVMVEGQSARLAQGGGTGVYEKRFGRSEIRPEMGDVRIAEHNEGVSWGTVSWLHSEDVTDIKPKEGEPLAIKKRLFVRAYTAQGPVLKPATGVLPLGAELVTRLELRTDRDMEFVHVKDCRAGCGQPLSEVSRYRRRKGGLCYYESVCDRASDFFIDLLPKGVYVFEYACRLQRKGVFSSGLAEVQCLYAPECKGYSGGDILTVGQE